MKTEVFRNLPIFFAIFLLLPFKRVPLLPHSKTNYIWLCRTSLMGTFKNNHECINQTLSHSAAPLSPPDLLIYQWLFFLLSLSISVSICSPSVWFWCSRAHFRSAGGDSWWLHSAISVRNERKWFSGVGTLCVSSDPKRTRAGCHHAHGDPQSPDCAAGGHAGPQTRRGGVRKEGLK